MNKILRKFSAAFVFIFIFVCLFTFAGNESKVDAQTTGIVRPDPFAVTTCTVNAGIFGLGRSGGATIDGSAVTYSPDVACGCGVSQCRLSISPSLVGEGGQSAGNKSEGRKWVCIPGSTTANARLTKDGYYGPLDGTGFRAPVDQFQDQEYWKAIAGEEASNDAVDRDVVYYLDIFSSDPAKQVIPVGSTCRVNPNDPNGTAYWFFPGYFDIIQGNEVSESNGIFVGGACAQGVEPLFTSTDLFGNKVQGISTFFGCLPNSINGLTAFIVRLVSGLSIGITFLIIAINLLLIVANSNNPDAISEYQKKMIAAITTMVGILLTLTILSIFGVQIIGFGSAGIGGGLFRFFVGG